MELLIVPHITGSTIKLHTFFEFLKHIQLQVNKIRAIYDLNILVSHFSDVNFHGESLRQCQSEESFSGCDFFAVSTSVHLQSASVCRYQCFLAHKIFFFEHQTHLRLFIVWYFDFCFVCIFISYDFGFLMMTNCISVVGFVIREVPPVHQSDLHDAPLEGPADMLMICHRSL